MKNMMRIVKITFIILFIVSIFANTVLGFTYPGFKPDTSNTGKIADVGSTIISTIRVLGMILSIGVLMVLGIKYMVGSTEEKAEYKKTMIPYVVGAILIFAATFIVSAIFEFANQSA